MSIVSVVVLLRFFPRVLNIHDGKVGALLFRAVNALGFCKSVIPAPREPLNKTIVCISDTHGLHRDLTPVPDGDILIHAGDFTRFGDIDDVLEFNAWLGELPHKHKIVVFGNHESGSTRDWVQKLKELYPDDFAEDADNSPV